ncbi:hypothetical protein TNCV_327371 [Trichonephila clavipes]|nr:hypothetical protein TNCV_327371 [Trichonephila clavipes]
MYVCKCIVPLRHGGTLNSRRDTSLLVLSKGGKERWENLLTTLQCVLPQSWGRTEPNHTVICMEHKATVNEQAYNLAPATMNFVNHDMILLSIDWHKPSIHLRFGLPFSVCQLVGY